MGAAVNAGMQFINAELGGSITADWQDFNGGGDEYRHSPKRGVSEHPLSRVASGSIVERVLHSGGITQTAGTTVNSFHLQVDGPCMETTQRIAPGLSALS